MDIYFSKKSLSHFKVDVERYQITICLVNGENFIVESFERFGEYIETLRKMLREYETYNDVVRYDTGTRKLYF
jgi:hypothetical protein